MSVQADRSPIARRVGARLRLLSHVVNDLGLPMVGLVISNSLRREMDLRRRARERKVPPDRLSPGVLEQVEAAMGGGRFVYSWAELEIRFLTHDVVRFSWGPGTRPVPYAIADELPWPTPQVAVLDRGEEGWELLSDLLAVDVSLNGELVIRHRGGQVLRIMAPPLRSGCAWEQRFQIRHGERFGGLGEQADGVDLSGGRFTVWNTDAGGAWNAGAGPLYVGIPVVLCTHHGGDILVFFENSTRAEFDFGASGPPAAHVGPRTPIGATSDGSGDVSRGIASVKFDGGRLRSYVISGDAPHLLERYDELTGRPAMPPRWALGYHQSRWGYKSETDIRDVSEGYERERLPLSAIHLDIDYMNAYRVFTFDHIRFPDPAGLSAELAQKGVRLVTIVDPGVKVDPHYELYNEGRALDVFCRDPRGEIVEGIVWPGRAAFPDFTNPTARTWWAKQYKVLTDLGVAGVWHDMNEPASISLRGDPTLPLDTLHDMEGRGGDHAEAHNLYGLLMNRAGFEGLKAARPDSRPFIVSRSGWAANQRWAWNWTGDADSTWQSMRQQVATLTGLGLSGVPFSGSDIGGFSGVPSDELYLRWLQMSVFMGFCRTHSVVGVPPREPWRFDEPTRSRIGAWIRFRYRLLPYLYTLARHAADTGAPLVRPVWWPTGENLDALGGASDEFLLGDCLLVAPVSQPGVNGRTVTLPAGAWQSIWVGGPRSVRSDRPTSVRLPAPVDRPPVLVRAGTILPLDDGFADPDGPCAMDGDPRDVDCSGSVSLDHAPRRLSFHCWVDPTGATSGVSARGVCFDDAGDGHGESRWDELELAGAALSARAALTWRRKGEYPVPSRVRVVLHGFESRRVVVDGQDIGPTDRGAIETVPFERLEFSELEIGSRPES